MFRIFIIHILITLTSQNYFLFNDIPQAFEDQMIKRFKVRTEDIEGLYSIFAFINLFTAPIGGYISNRIGYELASLYYSAVSVFGCILTYCAFPNNKFIWIIIGRIFYSFWTESVFMNATAMLEKYFRKNGSSLAFSLAFVIYGTIQWISNTFIPDLLLSSRSLEFPFFIVTMISSIQFFASFFLYKYFKEKPLDIRKNKYLDITSKVGSKDQLNNYNTINLGQSKGNSESLNLNFMTQKKELDEETKLTWAHYKTFKPFFWLFFGYYTFVASTIFSMNGALTDMFLVKFKYPYAKAKNFIGIIQLIQTIFMPFFGILLQKFGHKAFAILLCSFFAFLGTLWLLILPPGQSIQTYMACFILGLYYSLYNAATYQSIPMCLPDFSVSLGQGICAAGQQFTLIILPILIGIYSEARTPEAYQSCLYIWLGNSIIGLIFAIILFYVDFTGEKLLTLPEYDSKVKMLREKKNDEFIRISKMVKIQK